MANEEHVKILKQGVDAWNKWRQENPGILPDLSRADLSGAHLSFARLTDVLLHDADFSGAQLNSADLNAADLTATNLSHANLGSANLTFAHLNNANLTAAYLSSADLSGADLRGADLSGVDLSFAHLSSADLSLAKLSRAYLSNVDLNGADLTRADLSHARLGWTAFGNVDLSEVKGLDMVYHIGPSTIGIDTIYKSKGNILHKFLLDSGMPQEALDYLLPLAGKAIDFYSCFISYSSKDQAFAERLHADLQAKGVRCWFAPHNIQGGKKIYEQIDHAIRLHDKLLLVLSDHSMNSDWVKTEVYNARQQEEAENRRKLFPLSLVTYEAVRQWRAFDADIGKDMAREVREYFIPDFTHWKDHDAYQTAFERLLRDLKAEG